MMLSRRLAHGAHKAVRVQTRALSIHEYQSSELLRQYGIGTPRGQAASTAQQAYDAAAGLGHELVVKAQALTGGRGKGHFNTGLQSGVHMISSAEEARELAEQMLGNRLITKQSGAKGKPVSAVYVVERVKARHEAYLSILMDRQTKKPLIICSSQGGMNIEEVAHSNPDAIKKFYVDVKKGLDAETAAAVARSLGFSQEAEADAADAVQKLYKIFREKDATQIEINPLSEVEGQHTKVMCMDAKFGFDDNASFRQQEVYSWRDLTQEDPDEVVAKNSDLNFVKLQGNIGCLVNGAGLAMATMDVIKLYGGDPANFLDCGGGATPETIETAFKLILSNTKVKAIFVNIFGGIVRCDYVAQGLVAATKNLDVKVPIVARLQGTNLEEGRRIIKESGLKIYGFDELDPAAEKVVGLAASS
ncbi:AEL211Wp [Eremothecium gossypii ATCC 10895]|uniref:Succinate--CoA ligase [ADP-forming] subunit beta, mitochondrial n=1 Tax=Eremothecium gossypii (strain ATCC 10895 / CBS 109.51 / FGSC 9923 / NRRL Y-1056) TaxID=284811 RepID=Q758H3_EREGS|nr:AEL211Wp [Eremothecium gossypii ATCC 10895]AAS52474.1 AEL211Wp [Eremothecium gossypii ATCC 10895]AEY96773.1 FAEL211Wp [Eremothecium gossypii FDAG1]